MAQKYGICKSRSETALAQHISVLMNPPEEKQFDETELVYETVNKQLEETQNKYESLLNVILNGSEKTTDHGLLWLDFNKITSWLYKNEPQKYLERIEDLQSRKEEEWA